MTIKNFQIAQAFNNLADLLEALQDNPYRIRAYRKAARNIHNLEVEISELVSKSEDLTKIPGIGRVISSQIYKLFQNNDISIFTPKLLGSHLEKKPQELINSYHIKKTKDALKRGNIRHFRLFQILPVVEFLVEYLSQSPYVQKIRIVGDYRRRLPIVHEIMIIVSTRQNKMVIDYLLSFPQIREIICLRDRIISVKLMLGIVINVVFIPENQYAATSLFYTGSKSHYEHIRKLFRKKGYFLRPTGIHSKHNLKKVEVNTEKEIFQTIGLSYVPSELRENRGEIERAVQKKLPKLIKLQDIKGDLHCHTVASDGRESLETMVKTAQDLGYEYVAITDHSEHLKIAHGLNKKELLQQIREIDKLNEKLNGIIVLKATEVDILENGTLDFPNEILKELDLTVCSIHSKFRIPASKQTDRILRAMDNLYFTILGHATGRLIRSREPYDIDIHKILSACKDHGCFIELNAQPYRLDIQDIYCQLAKDMGVKIAISSDAHSIREMGYMKYGIFEARRGWLEANDVINTLNLNALKKLIQRY